MNLPPPQGPQQPYQPQQPYPVPQPQYQQTQPYPAPYPYQQPHPMQRPPQRPSTPVWVWILVGVLVMCFGGCGLVGIAASGDSKSKAARSSSTASVQPSAAPAAPAPEATTAEKPKSDVAPAGSAVRDGQFEFMVTEIEQGATHVGSGFWGKDAKGEFVLVHVSVSNIGNRAQTYFASNQRLLDDQGRRFEASFEANVALNDSEISEELNPGQQMTVVIAFDVPKGLVPVTMQFSDSMFSRGAKVALR